MHIKHLKISNILGIENLELQAGQFNLIEGKNGEGKTSILEAIKATLDGKAATANLVRKGAEQGDIVLVLDDNMTIERTIADKSSLVVRSENGKMSSPQTALNKLYDSLSINPISFITADKKTRVNLLLEAIPMILTSEHIEQLSAVKVDKTVYARHALESLQVIHKTAYDERTGINRAAKEKSNTVIQLKSTLPVGLNPDTDIESRLKELEETQKIQLDKRDAYFTMFEKDRNEQKELARLECEKIIAEARKDLDLKNQHFDAEYELKKNAKQSQFEEKHNPLMQEIGGLRSSLKQIASIEQTQKMIEQMVGDVDSLEAKSQNLTTVLATIEQIKLELLKDLPIEGLEIIDGEIFQNGVVFDRLNTAEQIKIALTIAQLRIGELKLLCVDGVERLDEEALNELRKQSEAAGLQLFLAKVSNSNLNIIQE